MVQPQTLQGASVTYAREMEWASSKETLLLSENSCNSGKLIEIDSKFVLLAKLSIEGPLRLQGEYLEGHFEIPALAEAALPEQLKAALGQASGTLQQLPASVKDVFSNGLTVPLNHEGFSWSSRCSYKTGRSCISGLC